MRILARFSRLIFWIVTLSIEVAYTMMLFKIVGSLHELESYESVSTTIRNFSLPILAVVALQVAVWRSTVAERQADAAQQQVVSSGQSLSNERYQKGAEMLGSEVLSVRLGGIYALGRLALERPEQYHIPIALLFCSFVRHPPAQRGDRHSHRLISDGMIPPCGESLETAAVGEDVTTIVNWIGARGDSQRSIERKAGVILSLDGADLRGIQLLDANLANLNLNNVDLSNSELKKVQLSGARMENARMVGVRISSHSNLSDANISDAVVCSAEFKDVDFSRADLRNADMSRALLVGCNFSDARLSGADLSDVTLARGRCKRVNFRGARFGDAKLCRADFEFSDVSGAYFPEADLSATVFSRESANGAIGLTQAQLDEAGYDGKSPPLLGKLVGRTGGKRFLKGATRLVWNG